MKYQYSIIQSVSKVLHRIIETTEFRLSVSIRQNIIIRITKQIKQPCNNESSILPSLPPLRSPRRTGGAARHLHALHSQPA